MAIWGFRIKIFRRVVADAVVVILMLAGGLALISLFPAAGFTLRTRTHFPGGG